MPRPRAYRPIGEIMDIFKITLSTVKSIIKKNKIDSFVDKGKMQINAKDFYKAYTDNFNPSLFDVWDKKQKTDSEITKQDNADIFQKLFGSPNKANIKKKSIANGLIGIGDIS